jgi:hypothetical protein
MKTRIHTPKYKQGSILLVVMMIITVLGIGLASYLTLMRYQHLSVARSQAWNAALAMAEAGVEEALAQLNPSALLFSTNIDRGANGWELKSDGMYHAPRRAFPDGYYDVTITADLYPRIYATGYVTIPMISTTVMRTVSVTTGEASVYRGLIAARVNVDLKGNGIATDSFDSMDPNYSTAGVYDPAKRKAEGDIASTGGIINVQNADVRGTLYTGPEGSFAIGPNGTVGDLSWPSGGGMQPGHYKNDFNMDFPEVLPPYSTAVAPVGATVAGLTYSWVLANGNYMVTGANDATFKSGDKILVTGRARVYVTGDFIMQAGSSIIIAPGASLQLYVAGANTTIATLNNAGNCATFTYFGLPTNKSITLSGNDVFLGSIYAPSADLAMDGGGNNELDFQGACAVNTIGMNGHFNFHFDENLKRKGPIRGYQIKSWTEI